MQNILMLINKLRNEEGQALVEYGLILGLIAVLCIGALTTMGLEINALFGNITNQLVNLPSS